MSKRLFLILILFFSFCFVSCDSKTDIVNKFMSLRERGNYEEAYNFIDIDSKKEIPFEKFFKYCFEYKVGDYHIKGERDGAVEVEYHFFDKRYKKGTNELYTFYVSKNSEFLIVKGGKIIFPHPLFIDFKEKVRLHDSDGAEKVIKKMLSISPSQKEVLELAEKMEIK